jgi:iron transport multicopper oxidase
MKPHAQSSQFQITVQNQLYDTSMLTATSVHWHGMFQKNTQWADGVALVSQCPIVPGVC